MFKMHLDVYIYSELKSNKESSFPKPNGRVYIDNIYLWERVGESSRLSWIKQKRKVCQRTAL
jgi:hypothetical protein